MTSDLNEIRRQAEPTLVMEQTTGDASPADVADIEEVNYGNRR